MSEDLRTTRTKNKIKDSFLTLLKNSSYEQITVSDIAKHANINRVTFYTHYIDKACLLADIMEDTKKKFVIDAIEYSSSLNETNEVIKYSIGLASTLVEIFAQNKDVITLLVHKENGVISKVLEEAISSFFLGILNRLNQVMPLKYPPKYVAAFLAPAYISLVMTYLNDKNPIPKEEFKKQVIEITENIISNKLFTK